jgi:hypothetical protein
MALTDRQVMAALNAVAEAGRDSTEGLPGHHEGHIGFGFCGECISRGRNDLFLDLVRGLQSEVDESGRVHWNDLFRVALFSDLNPPKPDDPVEERQAARGS